MMRRPSKFIQRPTHLDANNTIADVPMESDLVIMNEFLNYVSKIQEDILAMEAESGWGDVMPIMQDIPVTVLQRMHYYE